MLTFRQKIFITYSGLFLFFLAFIFPFASHSVNRIIFKSMHDRAFELIASIQSAPNNDALIRRLKDQKHRLFFRVSVITDEHKSLYDSHIKRLLGPKFNQEQTIDHPEVLEAFKSGYGYQEGFSELLGQKFSYMAQAFNFHGKTYVIRTAYPYKYVEELTHYFEIGFLSLSTAILLLFSLITWFIIHHLTNPIQQIIQAVKPYHESEHSTIPAIVLKTRGTSNEIHKLAETLNSLSRKVQKHIDTLTDERNEKSAILESLEEGVIAVDGSMCVTYANETALQFFGFQREQLLGKNFAITQQRPCIELLHQCQQQDTVVSNTLTLKQEQGRIYLDLVAAPIQKQGAGAVLVMQDKTAHYKILEMRKDFIANASHELKTPVTIINGFAETLHDNPQISHEVRMEITSKIMRNCKRMTTLIKDLLTLADIEHIPESRLIDCDLHDLASHCCELLYDAYPDAQITITPSSSDDFHLIADSYLLEMAITNLLENGIKYSDGPAVINLTLENRDENIVLSVSDQGIGIAEADLEHIFQRFYTVNKIQSVKKGGSGLGLSLVESIIEKHFGKITAQSEVGVGTTFTIVMPKKRPGSE
jgi:two-component system phosphate regulon sensor histidine kinase PhoR